MFNSILIQARKFLVLIGVIQDYKLKRALIIEKIDRLNTKRRELIRQKRSLRKNEEIKEPEESKVKSKPSKRFFDNIFSTETNKDSFDRLLEKGLSTLSRH